MIRSARECLEGIGYSLMETTLTDYYQCNFVGSLPLFMQKSKDQTEEIYTVL